MPRRDASRKTSSRTLSQKTSSRRRYNAVPHGSESESESRTRFRSNLDKRRRGDVEEIELDYLGPPINREIPKLTPEEKKLFKKIEEGDVEGARELIGSVNINKTNITGYTFLHMAIIKGNEELVKLLLEQSKIMLNDTILLAIQNEEVEITKILLEFYDAMPNDDDDDDQNSPYSSLHPSRKESKESKLIPPIFARSGVQSSVAWYEPLSSGSKSKAKMSPSRGSTTSVATPVKDDGNNNANQVEDEEEVEPYDSEFNKVLTPLMLAAQVGSTDLMEIFYKRGETLETEEFQHSKKCKCEICEVLVGEGDMTRSHHRVHLFQAITSPKYICFISRKEKLDPINYAIDKILKLRQICERDTIHEKFYLQFIKDLEGFITKMLDLCETTEEVLVFLSPRDSKEKKNLPEDNPRLWYAMGLDLRKFVAHHNAQTAMYKMWASDYLPEWDYLKKTNKITGILLLTMLFLAWPIFSVFCCLFPTPPRRVRAPVTRFTHYIGNYVIFLLLLSVQVMYPYQRCNDDYPYYSIDDVHCKERGPPRIGTEPIIAVFVLGYYVSFFQKLSSYSWSWKQRWNWLELWMLLSFTATFACWIYSYVWVMSPQNAGLIFATQRVMWPHDSPEILGECFLALSTILASARLIRFALVSPTIGPIQIGLGRQVMDFFSTTLIYVVILIAFAAGLLSLYVPYKDFEGVDKENKPKKQDDTFADISLTLQNLFWYLYGHAGNDPAILVSFKANASSSGGEGNEEESLVHHELTEDTGLALYFLYHIIGSMMMFSMLSGYFSQNLSQINKDIDTHWKFCRTELYLSFTQECVMAPPLNILRLLLELTVFRFCKNKEKKAEKEKKEKAMKERYRALITILIFRFNDNKDVIEVPEAEQDEQIQKEINDIWEFLGKGKKQSKEGDGSGDGPGSGGSPPPPPAPSSGRPPPGKTESPKGTTGTTSPAASSSTSQMPNPPETPNSAGSGGNAQPQPPPTPPPPQPAPIPPPLPPQAPNSGGQPPPPPPLPPQAPNSGGQPPPPPPLPPQAPNSGGQQPGPAGGNTVVQYATEMRNVPFQLLPELATLEYDPNWNMQNNNMRGSVYMGQTNPFDIIHNFVSPIGPGREVRTRQDEWVNFD